MSGQNNFNFYFYKWKTSFRKKIHRTCIRPWVRAFPKINNIPRWGKCFVLLFSWTFCCPVLGSWQCVSLYMPTPDPSRRAGITSPPYTKHFLICSCCLYGGGELVPFSSKTHCPPTFFLSRMLFIFFNIYIQYIYIVLPISKDLFYAKANLTFERVVCVYLSIWILKEQLRIS